MTHNLLLDHFDTIADSPGGVARLRALILQLAVRGMLVPQDPADEPASVLLERIRAEQRCRTRDKGRRTKDQRPPMTAEDVPYALPNGWEWTRLADVGHEWGQKKPDQSFTYIDVSAIDKERGVISNNVTVLQPEEAPSRARKLVREGTVIYSTVRPYLLNIAVVDSIFEPEPIVSTAFAVIHPYNGINNRYLYYYLRSQPFVDYVASQMKGMAYPAINDGQLFEGFVPLPPTNEQRRIVARVDALLALCDALEARQTQQRNERQRLQRALLDALTAASDADAVAVAWQRLADSFDMLHDMPDSVAPLRQAVLQLAVQGRLVEQDAADEPASVLLERVREARQGDKGTRRHGDTAQRNGSEQQRHAEPFGSAQDRLREASHGDTMKNNEMPFALPNGWASAFIDNLYNVSGGIQKTPQRRPLKNVFPYLRVANVYRGRLNLDQIEYFELFDGELDRWRLVAGDLLVVEGNGSENEVGRCALWNGEIEDCVHQNHLIRCRAIVDGYQEFILIFLNSPVGTAEMKRLAITTTGLYNLSVGKIRNIIVPLPPLAEQRRIVARVDELMALCDALEAGLRDERGAAERLAAALTNTSYGRRMPGA